MSAEKLISSSDPLPDIDVPFRLLAGPGAGKTYWLAGHTKRVLSSSKRLHKHGRVACITYTQIATDTLRLRLSGREGQVWISTIHSFLYQFLVRPYAYLLGEPDLNTAELDGHDMLRPSTRQGILWLQLLGKNPGQWHASPVLSRILERDLRWRRDIGGWKIGFSANAPWRTIRGGGKAFEGHEPLRAYKSEHWKRGRIDHDDVVYMASRLIEEIPSVSLAIAHRFPYIFLDEFQDTSLHQAEIVQSLAKAGAVVGVIGDRSQAIFEFNDASPEHLDQFAPERCTRYRIDGNRRSTVQIVRVLNCLRSDDLHQESIAEPRDGPPPLVLVGDVHDALIAARELAQPAELHLMARSHADVSVLYGLQTDPESPWTQLGDEKRSTFLAVLCRALRHFKNNNARLAIQECLLLFRSGHPVEPLKGSSRIPRMSRRAVGIFILGEVEALLSRNTNSSALDVYNSLREKLSGTPWGLDLVKVTAGGKFGKQASTVRFKDLLASVPVQSATGLIRTIHGFKGDQADAILLYISSKQLRKRLLDPKDDEETRLLYVALSRARRHAFVVLPELTVAEEQRLTSAGFEIRYLQPNQGA